jgi:hypothetical protein
MAASGINAGGLLTQKGYNSYSKVSTTVKGRMADEKVPAYYPQEGL